MKAGHLAPVLLALVGCASWEREGTKTRLIRQHYDATTLDVTRSELESLWANLDWTTPQMGCLSLRRPCKVQDSKRDRLCFAWGAERGCFVVEPDKDGGRSRLVRVDETDATTIERWLFSQLDARYEEIAATAEREAEHELAAQEREPIGRPNSFWAGTRLLATFPAFSLGLSAQGGYRRWLERNVLLAVGVGYERTLTPPRVPGEPRDSLLFTARFELSSWKWALPFTQLPAIAFYFGLTGVLGVAPNVGWTTRSFLGFSAIVPVSFEIGYAVSVFEGTLGLQNAFISVGLQL